MFKRSIFLIAMLTSAALTPLRADDLSNRVDQLQDQIRQLTGQIELLNYQVKQLQIQRKQAMASDVPPAPNQPNTQNADGMAGAQTFKRVLRPTAPSQEANDASGQGVEEIGDGSALPPQPIRPQIQQVQQAQQLQINGGMNPASTQQMVLAPPPGTLGMLKAAKPGDGGFQGKVLVGPDGTAVADDAQQPGDQLAVAEPASASVVDTPDDLFQRNYQALLQLRYPEAEAGFKDFIVKYPNHAMVGSAAYWLGEAYWAEQNFGAAAQAYQDSYHRDAKGRRAPDSLLKLGLSLSRLGQKDQACTIIGSVDTEYPNAVDVKKRAQAAFRREGCA